MVFWSLNFTRQPGLGRTTETTRFERKKDAQAFAEREDAHGYLLRIEDPTRGYSPIPAGATTLNCWVGDFTPSAAETAIINSLTA